ncbi:macrophage mannose receptor 1-like [Mytilus californianus]|uniref:macrophage mannose receptor 1-like n=1 Tax=Mytilus californianus TaxID=6549 RepID=UPI00224567E4|nr:macrophage mannose receptor 1-like [Mytilus californianus]
MRTSDHTYDEPTDEKGYTQLASISDNYRKYDDLKPSGSYHSYCEPQPDPQPYHTRKDVKIKSDISYVHDKKSKCLIKFWIAITTVIIIVLVAGLTHILIKSRYNTEVCIKSKGSGNSSFRISEILTKCPNDWKTFDAWCYKEFSQRRTWFKARDYCRSIGTDLVSVHNKRETNFLITNFTQTSQWIGLSNFQNNGKYVWSDRTILNYTDWGESEPNNFNNNENCAQLLKPDSQKWNDNNCFMSLRFICKMQINPRCGPGDWVYYENTCYSIDMSVANFTEARKLCMKNGSDLVIIKSKEEYNFIISQTTKHLLGADFWIGLQKLRNQTYRWIDGSHPTYLTWGIDEPKGDNNSCVKSSTMYGNWYGDSCSNQNWIVCEKQLLRNV